MNPSKIYELRVAMCPHCGQGNDVARPKCNHCGRLLDVFSGPSARASNDSVPASILESHSAASEGDGSASAFALDHVPAWALTGSAMPLSSPAWRSRLVPAIAGAAVLAGLIIAGYQIRQQWTQPNLAVLAHPDGAAKAPLVTATEQPPPAAPAGPVKTLPADPAHAAAVLRVPQPMPGATPGPNPKPRQDAARPPSRQTQAAAVAPAGAAAPNAKALGPAARVRAGAANDKAQTPPIGPCTAAVAALGLCTLEATKEAN